MKSKIKIMWTAAGMALAVYPASFLLYVFRDYDQLLRYVGTEFDVLMASTWLIGIFVFIVLSIYNAKALIRNIFAGVISSYAVSMTLFSHQHALSRFNEKYIALRAGTIIVAIILTILVIKNHQQEKNKEVKEPRELEIAALSAFYYGLSLVLLNLVLGTIFNSSDLYAANTALYIIWAFAAISGVLSLSRKRLPLIIILLINLANALLYIALTAGTVYFGENIGEALQSGIPGLFISITLMTLSITSLRYNRI